MRFIIRFKNSLTIMHKNKNRRNVSPSPQLLLKDVEVMSLNLISEKKEHLKQTIASESKTISHLEQGML